MPGAKFPGTLSFSAKWSGHGHTKGGRSGTPYPAAPTPAPSPPWARPAVLSPGVTRTRAAFSRPSRQYLYSVEGSGRVLGRSPGSCPWTALVVQEQVRSPRLRVTPRLKRPEPPELVLPGRRGADVAGAVRAMTARAESGGGRVQRGKGVRGEGEPPAGGAGAGQGARGAAAAAAVSPRGGPPHHELPSLRPGLRRRSRLQLQLSSRAQPRGGQRSRTRKVSECQACGPHLCTNSCQLAGKRASQPEPASSGPGERGQSPGAGGPAPAPGASFAA